MQFQLHIFRLFHCQQARNRHGAYLAKQIGIYNFPKRFNQSAFTVSWIKSKKSSPPPPTLPSDHCILPWMGDSVKWHVLVFPNKLLPFLNHAPWCNANGHDSSAFNSRRLFRDQCIANMLIHACVGSTSKNPCSGRFSRFQKTLSQGPFNPGLQVKICFSSSDCNEQLGFLQTPFSK